MASLGSHSNAFIPWKTIAQMHGSTGQLLKSVAPWYSDSSRHSLLLFPGVSASLQRSSSRIPSPTSPHSLTLLQHPQRSKEGPQLHGAADCAISASVFLVLILQTRCYEVVREEKISHLMQTTHLTQILPFIHKTN